MRKIDEQQAKAKLEKGFEKAGKLLNDKQKLDVFLDKLEIKLKMVPVVGESLSMLPVLFSLVKSFIAGEYKEIPLGSIIAVISALAYFLSPVDLIPDFFPGVGLLDDAAVVGACLMLVGSDIQEYQKWRSQRLESPSPLKVPGDVH